MTFADMLDERGMRQSQIARAAGLTRQRVNEWVRGVRDPRLMALGTARRVADALEMTTSSSPASDADMQKRPSAPCIGVEGRLCLESAGVEAALECSGGAGSEP